MKNLFLYLSCAPHFFSVELFDSYVVLTMLEERRVGSIW
jgi:hypothetical protein